MLLGVIREFEESDPRKPVAEEGNVVQHASYSMGYTYILYEMTNATQLLVFRLLKCRFAASPGCILCDEQENGPN